MKRIFIAAMAALLGTIWLALPVVGQAQPGPGHETRTSIFGTIERMEGRNLLEVRTWHSRAGYIDVRINGARINYNGLSLRRGDFAGFYGYFGPMRKYFVAEGVTLSTSAETYPQQRRVVRFNETGVVHTVEPGRVLIETRYSGYIWAYTKQQGLRPGERVEVIGTLNRWTHRVDGATVTPV